MAFRERLKEKRASEGISQIQLSKLTGISARTIQNYELGTSQPQSLEKVEKIAKALNTTVGYLMSNAEIYMAEAHEKGGARASSDIEALVTEVSGLFAGGTLDDTAIDGAMKALNDAYWLAKEKNQKYIPKKYKK